MSRKKTPKEPKNDEKPRVHPELEGFEIRINPLGEVTSSYDIDKINLFLNRHVEDKKFRDRNDILGRDVPTDDLDALPEAELDEDNLDETATLRGDFDDLDQLDNFDDDQEEDTPKPKRRR